MAMATQLCPNNVIPYSNSSITHPNLTTIHPLFSSINLGKRRLMRLSVQCSEKPAQNLRTCKNCKAQFDPLLNHPLACRYHTAHFGEVTGPTCSASRFHLVSLLAQVAKVILSTIGAGETRRKFESVYSGGTMDTPDSGKVFQYWHCCGSEDPFDVGCTAAPHASYDD